MLPGTIRGMPDDPWAALAEPFVEGAYASVKGEVRTYVLHAQLLRHLPGPPATVLDVGGGAAHQSLPLARLGHDVTLLDPSPAMLARAEQRLQAEPDEVRRRGRLVHAPGGLVSLMALNARTLAVRPALDRRWEDALAAFDATGEVGVLGADTRGDTVEGLSGLLRTSAVEPVAWYGVWLFADWLDLPPETTDVPAVAAVELAASLRDPYRGLSRVFHLVGRRAG